MNNKQMPLISVIIALYNPGKHLYKCLDSIVNQTYKNLEIILVDDGSTDSSLSVCKEYAEKDSRVIVHHKDNSGVSATRNAGIRLAHGDYFSFIDSDDYLEPDAYEYMIELIQKHNVDAVNYEHFVTYTDREAVHMLKDENYGLFDRKQAMYQLVHNVMFAWNKLFSRRIIEGVWFDEEIARGEDGLFSRLAINNADKVWFDKRPLYHYVQSDESAVRGNFRKSQLSGIKLIDRNEPFFKKYYPELYDSVMSNLLHLITTLYLDMRRDKKDYRNEQKMIVKKYKELYSKVNLKKTSRNYRIQLRTFRISPTFYYLVKNTIFLLRSRSNG